MYTSILKVYSKASERTNSLQVQTAQTQPTSTLSAISFCDMSAFAFLLFTGPYVIGMWDGGNSCGSNGIFKIKQKQIL